MHLTTVTDPFAFRPRYTTDMTQGGDEAGFKPRFHVTSKHLLLVIPILWLVNMVLVENVQNYFHPATLRRVSGGNGSYKVTPHVSPRTVEKQIVAETKFARCEYHTVKPVSKNGVEEDGELIHDWLFLEERPAINVVIVNEQGQFLVYQQEKYAIPGKTYSIVGGFIDDGESPYEAAKREVLEEIGLGSRRHQEYYARYMQEKNYHQEGPPEVTRNENRRLKSDNPLFKSENRLLKRFSKEVSTYSPEIGRIHDNDPDWVYLGKYRTAANRGGGYLYSYLLKNAVPVLPNGGTNAFKAKGDNEKLDVMYLYEGGIMSALSKSEFKEVKWTATLALAMLYLRDNLQPNT